MDAEDTETLFSFEVHVEIVEELRVSCRLPAVSFRLLDFPTLIIHHVAPSLADNIRQKVDLESEATDPILSELRDRRGNFQVQKGKSCLLKVNLKEFHTHLQTVPLYVMLIDLWPKKPKLVGSTTVALKAAINKIYGDISRNGIAVPAFFREENTFEVYNLMGSVIAKIKLGYRLLSLGGALLPHIPHGSLLKRDSDREHNEARFSTGTSITPGVTSSPKVKTKVPVVTIPTECNKNNISVGKQDVRVQTDEYLRQGKKQNNPKTDYDDAKTDCDDIFITNTICPPPLYYNFLSDTKQETVLLKGKSRGTDDVENKLYFHTRVSQPRAADTLVSRDVDYEYYDPGVLQKDGTVGCTSIAVQTTAPMSDKRAGAADTNVDDAVKHFPLLNALLQELSSVANIKDTHKPTSPRLSIEVLQNEAGKQKVNTKTPTSNVPSGRLTGNNYKQTDTRRVHSALVKGQLAVIGLPKERPKFRKSNLTYKMTKTQRMRLEMNQKAKQGGERTRRPCVAWAEDVVQVGPSQELGDGRRPSSASRVLGTTYKLNHRQDFGSNTAGVLQETCNARISSKQLISTEMQTEVKEAVTSDATQHREPQQVDLPPASGEKHREPKLAEAPGRGRSPVESTRSYKSQSSLEVYLPAMDGDSEEGSVTDKDIEGTDDDEPLEPKGAYGYTGILPSEPASHGSLDTQAPGTTSFDDQQPWESKEEEENPQPSSSASFDSIGSKSPQLHSNSSSENKHKLHQSNSDNSRSSNQSWSKNPKRFPQSRHSPMKVTKSKRGKKSSTTSAVLGRAKVNISGSTSDISLPGLEASPLDLAGVDDKGLDEENSIIYSREGSFAYSEDFVSAESHKSNSESCSSVGSGLEQT